MPFVLMSGLKAWHPVNGEVSVNEKIFVAGMEAWICARPDGTRFNCVTESLSKFQIKEGDRLWHPDWKWGKVGNVEDMSDVFGSVRFLQESSEKIVTATVSRLRKEEPEFVAVPRLLVEGLSKSGSNLKASVEAMGKIDVELRRVGITDLGSIKDDLRELAELMENLPEHAIEIQRHEELQA